MPNHLDHINLRSEEVQDILTAIPNWMIRWGNSLILSLIVLLIAVSWFVKYPDIIQAEVVITTEEPPQKEYAKTSGKLDSFLVSDNQIVKAKSPLAILENSAKYEDVCLLASFVDKVRLNKRSFYFPMDSLPILFLGDIESDFALFENSYDQYLLNKSLQPFSKELIANRSALSELTNRLKNLELQYRISASELNLKKIELDRNEKLLKEGIVSAQDFERIQLQMLQAERNFKNMEVSISQIKESISTAKLSSQNININRTKEEKALLRTVLQSFTQLKKSIKEWELKYVLTSSIEGKVAFLEYWTKNQTVKTGDLVFTIIPIQYQEYIAKLKTPALNSGKVKLGQKVNIKLANYPESEFGSLEGKIKKISLIADEEGAYLVDVSLSNRLITSYNKELVFRQEMKGQAEIITEDLRLIERFFYRLKSAFKA